MVILHMIEDQLICSDHLLPCLQDIGSGNCAVHNTLLVDFPQKSVLHAPWRYYPTHLWSSSNRNLEAAVPAAMYFMAYPNIITLISPALAALRG